MIHSGYVALCEPSMYSVIYVIRCESAWGSDADRHGKYLI